MAAAGIILFGANRFPDIEDSILDYLVNVIRHPQASARFATHFLAFPLLRVNRHLRQLVARLLYKIAFETERKPILYPEGEYLEYDSLVLAPSDGCLHRDARMDDDPRRIFRGGAASEVGCAEYFPTSLDETSPSLVVSFQVDAKQTTPSNWAITTDAEGREHRHHPTYLQAASTAWFEEAWVTPTSSVSEIDRSVWEPEAYKRTYNIMVICRHGLRAVVPTPVTEGGLFYDVALPPTIRPKWATKGDPGPHCASDASLDPKFPGWQFTYESEAVDINAITTLYDGLRLHAGRDRVREKNGFFEDVSSLRVQLIQISLLELLRPPISRKSPYR